MKKNQRTNRSTTKRVKKSINRKPIAGLSDVQTTIFRNLFDDREVSVAMLAELNTLHKNENVRAKVVAGFAFIASLQQAGDSEDFDTLLAELIETNQINNYLPALGEQLNTTAAQAEQYLNEMIEAWDINLKLAILTKYDII